MTMTFSESLEGIRLGPTRPVFRATLFTDLRIRISPFRKIPYFQMFDPLSQRICSISMIFNPVGKAILSLLDMELHGIAVGEDKGLDIPYVQVLIGGDWDQHVYQGRLLWTFFPFQLVEVRRG